MSYTDYLNRMKINTPKILNTQMRLPDASSFTWRTKLANTYINRRTDHVINNSQDNPAPRLFSPAVKGYPGSGFGGRVQDASSYTLSLGAASIGADVFTSGQIISTVINAAGNCLTTTPASQVISEFGNAETRSSTIVERSSLAGLNMGYMRQRIGAGIAAMNVGVCTDRFNPLTTSQFVDTIPEIKTRKIGTQSRDPGDNLGRQIVQNPITTCTTTNTSGDIKGQAKSHQPYNSYSALPNNAIGSGPNVVHGSILTGVQGAQVGGGNQLGERAAKVGSATVLVKNSIPHRSWGNVKSRIPYPYMGTNGVQPPAPAQKRINQPIQHIKGI
uniref:Uncharacterized protein n=1 Tax=viral metagenome TaxID=1070528 RepID=A0A6C0JKJ9_9ZZZZ